jgi:hypothetical protein
MSRPLSSEQALWLAETFARNRARFGDLRMEVEGGDGGDPAAPAPKPEPPKQPDSPALNGNPEPGPDGFAPETPWRSLPPEQQAAYWRHQAKKWESDAKKKSDELAQVSPEAQQFRALTEASKTDLERERDAAIAQVETLKQQAAEAKRTFGVQLVETRLSAAADGKGMTAAALKTLAGDMTRFLGDDGVNGDAVDEFLAALPDKAAEPQQPEQPRGRVSLGAGNRAPGKQDPLDVGASRYEARHGKRKTSAS